MIYARPAKRLRHWAKIRMKPTTTRDIFIADADLHCPPRRPNPFIPGSITLGIKITTGLPAAPLKDAQKLIFLKWGKNRKSKEQFGYGVCLVALSFTLLSCRASVGRKL